MLSTHIDTTEDYAIIHLNRPSKKNSFDFHMFHELAEFFKNEAHKYKCVIITGSGSFFSAGIDIEFVNTHRENLVTEKENIVVQFMNAFTNCPVPICALVNGPAIGVGFTLLLWCDFVYHTKNAATFLQAPFIQLGLTPDFGSSTRLAQMVGTTKAREILFCAKHVQPEILSSECVESIENVIHDKLSVLLNTPIELIKQYKRLSKNGTIQEENECLRGIMRSAL